MKTLTIILLLAIGIPQTTTAQYRTTQLNTSYGYFEVGLSGATKPHTEQLILNGVVTAGVRYSVFDISVNYEYANLTPKYHSWFFSCKVVPITVGNFEFLIGGRYGRIARESRGVYLYYGAESEIRYTFVRKHNRHKKRNVFFIALSNNYTFGGDKEHLWGSESYWDNYTYSSYFHIGVKL